MYTNFVKFENIFLTFSLLMTVILVNNKREVIIESTEGKQLEEQPESTHVMFHKLMVNHHFIFCWKDKKKA